MIKLAFSTLSCPGWSWNEIISVSKDLGFDGIGVRGIEQEMDVPKASIFDEKHIENTVAKLKKLKLDISCLVSGCYIFKDDQAIIDNAKE